MTYDDFTVKAQEAILQGQRIAAGFEQQMVDTPHLIKGIIETNEDSAKFILQKAGINLTLLDRELSNEIRKRLIRMLRRLKITNFALIDDLEKARQQ